jgi:septum formation protein
LLNGTSHTVCSGIAVINKNGKILSECETTKVFFRTVSLGELRWYIKTGEPLDKAGAYGIQGKGAFLVERIEGCYYNVVGFPVARFLNIMERLEKNYVN